jgi:hypothetical protein
MPEVEKLINFNAFHILLIVLISNIIINRSIYLEYIVNTTYYILSMNASSFWFLTVHVVIAYNILTSLKIELGIRAAIKFNL